MIGSNTTIDIRGKKVRGRQYPWGIVESKSIVKPKNIFHSVYISLLKYYKVVVSTSISLSMSFLFWENGFYFKIINFCYLFFFFLIFIRTAWPAITVTNFFFLIHFLNAWIIKLSVNRAFVFFCFSWKSKPLWFRQATDNADVSIIFLFCIDWLIVFFVIVCFLKDVFVVFSTV